MRRRQAVRRRQAAVVTGLALLAILVLLISGGGSAGHAGRGKTPARAQSRKHAAILGVESGLLPWRLPSPVSREVLLPGARDQLTMLGGLNGSTSMSGVFLLSTANGALRQVGNLRVGIHDAVGAIVEGRDLVFGGGSPSTVGAVDGFPAGAAGSLGQLPSARSDAGVATIRRTTYIVGGYDGTNADRAVLMTTDGRNFRSVASLPVPVRYPAVAAVGGKLYVFGGEAISGRGADHPVDDIQMVDPETHSASVVSHLPEPLEASAAFVLGGQVYLAGGDSTTSQPSRPGVGTTQLPSPLSTSSSGGLSTVSTIWAFDLRTKRTLVAGGLQVPVSHAGVAELGSRAWLVGGESGGAQLTSVQMITLNASFGTAGAAGAGSPFFGDKLLVADRANNHLLLFDPTLRLLWRFPSSSSPPDPLGFFFPDDAFFVNHGTAILTNQEENETLQEIGYPSGKVLWSYGHPRQTGTAQGYLSEPDDAYLLKNGQISVADANNCRVLVINQDHTVAHQIGSDGVCKHNPPTSMGSPNGDTPLSDGNLLVSEITGSWVTEFTPNGNVVWTVHLPISYPSDPQQLGPDLYLIADYARPGQIIEFNRAGQILYRYAPTSGPGMLNHPSLVERLPSGVFMANDDYRDRMVAIDPATGALVWQYGITDRPGTGPGKLNTPDGFDLLTPDGSTPTHPATG